jgi:hypothetical protein
MPTPNSDKKVRRWIAFANGLNPLFCIKSTPRFAELIGA